MRFWPKDHVKEIQAGGAFSPANHHTAAPSSTGKKVTKTQSSSGDETKSGRQKRRGFLKRTLGLGDTTPPRPDSYLYDPRTEEMQRFEAFILEKQQRAPKRKKGEGLVYTPAGFVSESEAPRRVTIHPEPHQSSRPKAEPITTGWHAGAGVGSPDGSSVSQGRREPAGHQESRESEVSKDALRGHSDVS